MNRKKAHWNWMVTAGLVIASILLYSFNVVLAAPPYPPPPGHHPPAPPPGHPPVAVIGPPAPWKDMGHPPPGKVWFQFQGAWVAVPPPPGGGPYLWNGRVWVIDSTPPPIGAEWITGRWTPDGWVTGHWKVRPAPRPGALWVPGHWSHGGHWIPGRWK